MIGRTIDEFIEIANRGMGAVVVIAGSDSDKDHIEKVEKWLQFYGIHSQFRIQSGHKQPEGCMTIAKTYNKVSGPLGYITIAGGSDALSGLMSCNTLGPVVSCPLDATPGEPNISCLTNPPLSSNAYICRPKNAARFYAQMFSSINPEIKKRLEDEMTKKISDLEKADRAYLRGV